MYSQLTPGSYRSRDRFGSADGDLFLELFSPAYARRTILNSIYLLVSIVGLWAGSVYVPASVTHIAMRQGFGGADAARRYGQVDLHHHDGNRQRGDVDLG